MVNEENCCNEEKCCNSVKTSLEKCLKNMPSDSNVKFQTEFFKAISDPARIKIIYALAAKSELCVCELMEITGMQQTVVSHHLKVLKYAKLISDRKSGKWVYYSLTDRRAFEVLKAIEENP